MREEEYESPISHSFVLYSLLFGSAGIALRITVATGPVDRRGIGGIPQVRSTLVFFTIEGRCGMVAEDLVPYWPKVKEYGGKE